MPVWAQVILAIAALVTAVSVIWRKVVRPSAKLIADAERMLPVLQEMTKQLADVPNSFAILKEIVGQLRTDSGSSLLDIVHRLDEAAKENKVAAEVLKVNVETARRLSEQDRQQVARLLVLLERVTAKIDDAAVLDAVIATNLEATHGRAEALPTDATPGEASDAAMRRPDDDP